MGMRHSRITPLKANRGDLLGRAIISILLLSQIWTGRNGLLMNTSDNGELED